MECYDFVEVHLIKYWSLAPLPLSTLEKQPIELLWSVKPQSKTSLLNTYRSLATSEEFKSWGYNIFFLFPKILPWLEKHPFFLTWTSGFYRKCKQLCPYSPSLVLCDHFTIDCLSKSPKKVVRVVLPNYIWWLVHAACQNVMSTCQNMVLLSVWVVV